MDFVLDQTKPLFRHFEEMTRIPHGSFHEKPYSDHLVTFAKEHNLPCLQDELGNVIIYKKGSAGYEDHPTVILQAHMDMVCAKETNIDHDFEKDPLKLHIKDGFLYAEGTTLGADDGVGTAAMLAILESQTLKHPPLECVFTVQEEVGMFGAFALKREALKGRRMVSLDGTTPSMVASAGGQRLELEYDTVFTSCDTPVCELKVYGLLGGHSGACIAEERGNALKILSRLLREIQKHTHLRLVSITGGEKENAIPRFASAVFAVEGGADTVRPYMEELFHEMKAELRFSDNGLEMSLTDSEGAHSAMNESDTGRFLKLFYLLPDGLRHRNLELGIAEASENLAIVETHADHIKLYYSLRSASDSLKAQMAEEVSLLAEAFACRYIPGAAYPSWPYKADSFMREKLKQVYKKATGTELETTAVHGGLECGVFADMDKDMDIVNYGPIVYDVHTPNEHLDMASFEQSYEILTDLLSEL